MRSRRTPVVTVTTSGWIVLLLASAAVAAADEPREPRLDVLLCDVSSLPAGLVREISEEAAAVWRDAGVAVRVAADARCNAPASLTPSYVTVRIDRSTRLAPLGSRRTIASIVFRGGHPMPVVTLSLQAARWLTEQDPTTRGKLALVSQRHADTWMGRMLGRALAHELGHYLLRSPEHSTTGLMRATHPVEAFVAPDRRAFHLTPAERTLLLAAHAMPALTSLASAKN